MYITHFATLLTFVTEMTSQPPPINRAKIPEFLEKYSGICANCEIVKRVFSIYQQQNNYSENTDLVSLIKFIIWCESSMVSNEKYTDTYIRKLCAGEYPNHEPIFQNNRKSYTDKGVNIVKFRKSSTIISKFRHEVYISLFSDILDFENYEKIRYKKELFDAAQCGNSDEVRRIFDNRHPSIDDYIINKAIRVSIWNGYNDVTQILIGYSPTTVMRRYDMWFDLAVNHDNVDYVRMPVATQFIEINSLSRTRVVGFERFATPLCYAITRNYRSMVEALINLRADIHSGTHKHQMCLRRCEHVDSPLYIVSESGNSDMVELLITSKASVDATDESLKTPLHAATQAGHIEIVKKLLDAKSDFNAVAMGPSPNTPLQIARANNNEEILMLFR